MGDLQLEVVTADGQTMSSLDAPYRTQPIDQNLLLQRAVLKGDWKAAEDIIKSDQPIVGARLTAGNETALHIAAASRNVFIVAKLVEMMKEEEVNIQNSVGATALCFAASSGVIEIAKIMVRGKARTRGEGVVTPLYMAALQGHREMADYLYSLSNVGDWDAMDQITLLNTCISSGLPGLALKLFKEKKALAMGTDRNGETPLGVLAKVPSTFFGENQQPLWRRITHSLFPGAKVARNETEGHELLKTLWQHLITQTEDKSIITTYASGLLFIATKFGNVEFLVELLSSYPDFVWTLNEHQQTIFHVAVIHRDENIFNLIHEIGFKDLITTYSNPDNRENILHLAAKLPPRKHLKVVSGAALQMQRELLWFKEVEKLVRPLDWDAENSEGKTPHDLFAEEHEQLMKEGEKWMRETATSCMLVATLITTVVFTTAFTVPGGYKNDTGAPSLLNKKFFMVFVVSEGVAMLSSSTSILMFLSILTSRYAENDFLKSLPIRLMIGVITLFISVAAMMVSFCTAFLLPCRLGLAWALILSVLFGCVLFMYVPLTYSLLADIIRSTFVPFFKPRSRKRLFE